jgi:flagellar protein FliS
MDASANESYIEAQVTTATPQRLRLMLIEAAIRHLKRTLSFWEKDENEEALEALVRARAIVAELLSAIKPDKTELTQKVAGVYVFLFNALTKAQLRRDTKGIEETIEVLEVERETWRLVCEKLPHAPAPRRAEGQGAREITAAEAAETLARSPHAPLPDVEGTSDGGLLLDA